MKLPSRVKALSEVDSNLQVLYKPDGAEFVLNTGDPAVAAAASVITGLSSALDASRGEVTALKGVKAIDLSPLSEYGADPTSIAAHVKTVVEGLQAKGGEQAKAIETVRKELTTSHTAALGVKDAEITRLNTQIDDLLLGSEIVRAASGRGVDPEMIRPFVEKAMKVLPDSSGKRRAVVLDATGQVVYSAKVAGAEMGVDEYMGTLLSQDRFKVLVPSKAPSGGGARPSPQTQPTVDSGAADNKTPAQRIAAGLVARGKK